MGNGSFDYNCNGVQDANPAQTVWALCKAGSVVETDGSQYADYFGGCTNPTDIFYCSEVGLPPGCGGQFNPAMHVWPGDSNCGSGAYELVGRADVTDTKQCH